MRKLFLKHIILILTRSSILVGGQAVIEGVMMRVPGAYATAVRLSNGNIKSKKHEFISIIDKYKKLETTLLKQAAKDKDSIIKLNKAYAELTPLVEKINEFQDCRQGIIDLKELQNDSDELIRNEAEKEILQENKKLDI